MEYHYENSNLICSRCNCEIPNNGMDDRHSCYWIGMENGPIGLVVLELRGQYSTYNSLEKKIAKTVWVKVKAKNKPKKIKNLKLFESINVEMYERWVVIGDEAVR